MKPEPAFNIIEDSKTLKDLVSIYDSEDFLKHIADIITLIQPPRIPYKPFVSLDSPLIQLFYIASLNISSSVDSIKKQYIEDEDWNEIIRYTLRVKAGYFDALLPGQNDDEVSFYNKYKIVMPVFMDYYNSGTLNFEEQEIDKIKIFFSSFNKQIIEYYGLSVIDFINIYDLIDKEVLRISNKPVFLKHSDKEVFEYWELRKKEKSNPEDWVYDGENQNVIELINFFKDPSQRFIISKAELYKVYDKDKIDNFFALFSINRESRDYYFYYTSPILLIQWPLYNIDNNRYLILDVKQIIHAIYKELAEFSKGIGDKFYKKRGIVLQEKLTQILNKAFNNQALIFNEYSTTESEEKQDVLLLHNGLALIIEAKAGREPEPRRDANVKSSFDIIARNFNKAIQEGYIQADRIKELFDCNVDFSIINLKGEKVYSIKTKRFHSVFSIIITLDKYREAQININHLLELNDGDTEYPISMCLDDFEVLFLSFRKMKVSLQKIIRFFKQRQNLQGRIEANDELQIWADLILNPSFQIPKDPHYHYVPSIVGADLFDELYESGLGLEDEKLIDEKKKRRIFSYREFLIKHNAEQLKIENNEC